MLTDLLDVAKLRLLDLDDRSHKLFQPYSGSAPVRALDVFSKLGDQPELRVIAGGLILAGMFMDSDRLVRAGGRMLLAHEAAALVKNVFKTNIDRTRPRSATSRNDKKARKGKSNAKEQSSFPSGHSAGAIAAARALSREYPEYGAALTTAAALVATSRVLRCAHYPTDVTAGILLGLAVESGTNAVWDGLNMDGGTGV
ncbi:MAG: phosphatase PAP2 family protein [Rhizomicrobium sp.]